MTKQNTEHTPGPYYIHMSEDQIDICRQWDDVVTPGHHSTFGSYLGAHIAKISFNTGVPSLEQAKANANLIAAAPAMLEALKALEWRYKMVDSVTRSCAKCGRSQYDPAGHAGSHATDCTLAAAIKAATGH